MATKQWNRQQFYKNDIFKPNYLLTAQVYMNYACIALITFVVFLNANNKITQNCYIFVTMAPKKWKPQQFDKNDIYKPKYVLTTNKYMIRVYVFLFLLFCCLLFFCKLAKGFLVWLPWLQKLERNNFSYILFGIKLPNCSNLGSIYIVHIHCTLVFVRKRYFRFNMSLFAKSQMAA